MLPRFLRDVVFHLGHRDNPARALVVNDTEELEFSWRIAIRPDIHAVDDFSRPATAFNYRVPAFPSLVVR